MNEPLDWGHHESFHLGVLSKELELDCIVTEDDCFEVNGYKITTDTELADFVSALKIIADRDVFRKEIKEGE